MLRFVSHGFAPWPLTSPVIIVAGLEDGLFVSLTSCRSQPLSHSVVTPPHLLSSRVANIGISGSVCSVISSHVVVVCGSQGDFSSFSLSDVPLAALHPFVVNPTVAGSSIIVNRASSISREAPVPGTG